MNITHVLRGHEWQTSTSKHLLLYKAFQWKPPIFGHLPLLERERGRKLSKRDPENVKNPIEIEYYRQKGYYADGILNFITLCGGGGFSDLEQVIGKTLTEMISLFDIKLFSRHAAIVDFKKLELCQRAHLRRAYYDQSKESRNQIFDEIRRRILVHYPEKKTNASFQLQDEYLEKIFNMIDFRISLLDELFSNDLYEYLWKEPQLKLDHIDCPQQFRYVIEATLNNLNEIQFNYNDVKTLVSNSRELKLDNKKVFRIWRLVLCGCVQGPPVHEIASFFGSEIVRKRLKNALVVLDRQNENVQKKM